jgi:hypothetical protein
VEANFVKHCYVFRVPDITLCKRVVINIHEIHKIYVVVFGGVASYFE